MLIRGTILKERPYDLEKKRNPDAYLSKLWIHIRRLFKAAYGFGCQPRYCLKVLLRICYMISANHQWSHHNSVSVGLAGLRSGGCRSWHRVVYGHCCDHVVFPLIFTTCVLFWSRDLSSLVIADRQNKISELVDKFSPLFGSFALHIRLVTKLQWKRCLDSRQKRVSKCSKLIFFL